MIESVLSLIGKASHQVVFFLFRETVYSTAVCAVVLLLQWMLRKRSHHIQTGLWLLVFIRLVLPTDLSHPFSGRALIAHWFDTPVLESLNLWMGEESGEASLSMIEDDPVRTSNSGIFHLDGNAVLFVIWLVGASVLMILMMRRLVQYHRMIASGQDIIGCDARAILNEWRYRFGVRRSVRLLATKSSISPFTSGICKPVILIPESLLMRKHRSDLESVIAHEMAHIKRLDDLWIKLQNLIQIIYFFHPVVWIAGSRLQVGRECACDSLVLKQNRIRRETYARGLLNIIKMNTLGPDCVALIPSFSSERNKLFTRLKRMKGEHNMRGIHKIGMIGLLTGLAVFILPMATSKWQPLKPGPQLSAMVTVLAAATAQSAAQAEIEAAAETETFASDFKLIMPVEGGKIVSGYGMRKDPLDGKLKLHRGVDIPEKEGTPVMAAADGVVEIAEFRKGYGNFIEIRHGSKLITRYGQLEKILVKPGMSVKQKEQIGTVGQTGRSTGPHLHFEVRIDDEAIDPVPHLK